MAVRLLSILCSAALSGLASAAAAASAIGQDPPSAPATASASQSVSEQPVPPASPTQTSPSSETPTPTSASPETRIPAAPAPETLAAESPAPTAPAPETPAPPARPASRVLDQTGALTAGERAGLSREFTAAAETGLSIYYIALDSKEGLAGLDAAGELARLWEDAPFTAVFLNVPGEPLTIGYSGPAAASLSQEELKVLTESALSAGHLRQSMPEQGKAAARRLTEDYTRYRAGGSLTLFAGAHATEGSNWSPHEILLWGGALVIAALLLVMFLLRRNRVRRPKLFPLTAPRARFSAPHSGGNNAMISFPNDRAD